MFRKEVKSAIAHDCKEELSRYDCDKMIKLYEMAVDLPAAHVSIEGLSKNLSYSINKLYGSLGETSEEELEIICKSFFNIEPFLKKVLYIADSNLYEQLYQSHNVECGVLLDKLGMVDSIKKADGYIPYQTNPETLRGDKYQTDHILSAYQLRNITAHEMRNWSRVQMFANIQDVTIAALYTCYKHRGRIEEAYEKNDRSVQIDADALTKQIVTEYEKNIKSGFKFIPIKWCKKDFFNHIHNEEAQENSSMDAIKRGIDREKHIMLLGEAGCGKTTSIEYLEYQDAKEWRKDSANPIPVKIRLSQATENWFSIEDTICDILGSSMDYCQKLLKKGALHVYLDGINEIIASTDTKKKVVIQIEKFLSTYPNTFIVITDRENVEIKIDMEIPTYYLHQMDSSDIRDYISQKTQDAELAARVLEYTNHMAENGILFTPIILNFLINYSIRNEAFPETSTDFFREYLKTLLHREYAEKKDINAAPGRLDSLLMYLALQIPDEGMSDTNVLHQFAKCKQYLGLEELDTKKCLNLALQLCILENDNDKYKFANNNYLECFLADALDKGMEDWDE